MADYTLSAKITGDATGFDRAIKAAERSAGNFQKTIGDMGKKLSSAGIVKRFQNDDLERCLQEIFREITKLEGDE